MKQVPGHPRLYRRGAVYYHRAAIPVDIKDAYPKSEETFSLGTKDHKEALRLVGIAAVEVDQRFDAGHHKAGPAIRNEAFLLALRDSGVKFVAADLPDANDLTVGIMLSKSERLSRNAQRKC